MKSRVLVLLVLGYFLINLFSCGKKEHEVIVPVDADTIKTTVVIEFIRDTIFVELEDKVIIDVNGQEVQNVYLELDENTINETVVLTFDNSTGQEYSMVTGIGFDFLNNQLIVTDKTVLNYEAVREIVLLAEVISDGGIDQFKIIVGLKDVVDVIDLKAHFNFDEQTLQDQITGKSLVSSNPVAYEQIGTFENYYINFSGNDEVLEWDESTIDLNEDFAICFFANHQLKTGVVTESILVGYDDVGNQLIRLYFEEGKLKVELEGYVLDELEYSFFTPSKVTQARVAFIKYLDKYTLRVNDNGEKSVKFQEAALVIPAISRWSFGAENSESSTINNEFSGRLDNIRFYQREITYSEYQSIISVDF